MIMMTNQASWPHFGNKLAPQDLPAQSRPGHDHHKFNHNIILMLIILIVIVIWWFLLWWWILNLNLMWYPTRFAWPSPSGGPQDTSAWMPVFFVLCHHSFHHRHNFLHHHNLFYRHNFLYRYLTVQQHFVFCQKSAEENCLQEINIFISWREISLEINWSHLISLISLELLDLSWSYRISLISADLTWSDDSVILTLLGGSGFVRKTSVGVFSFTFFWEFVIDFTST